MDDVSTSALMKQYEEECYFGDDRAAAEYASVLAVRLRDVDMRDEASGYAAGCLRLAERLPCHSLVDVASDPTLAAITAV